MKRYLFLTACVALSAILFAACGSSPAAIPASGASPVAVDYLIISADTFARPVQANGTIRANENVVLQPEISGRITALHIREGSRVSAGELLVKLYDDDLQAQLRKYRSQLDIAEKTAARLHQLLAVNGITQQEVDQADSQVAGLKADIDLVTATIRKTEVRAPFSGTIGLRAVSEGAYVSPGQELATLQDLGKLKIDFLLTELQSQDAKEGTIVSVTSPLLQAPVRARVIGREASADATTRNITVRAELIESAPALYPGAFVSVTIERPSNPQAILVPTHAIIPESRAKKVAVLRGGKVAFTPVETGFRLDDRIEVTSGLAVGDTIATSGLLFLKPGVAVILKAASAAEGGQ